QLCTVRVDRTKILSHGKPALGRYLCRLHIWRCTADFASCKSFYEPLCKVHGVFEHRRQIVCSKPNPSNKGIIQSWVERDI
ncbi:hypothetical protein GQ44DRAFT_634633, partial [Phaeosphaeriaceae sp. PMI808]